MSKFVRVMAVLAALLMGGAALGAPALAETPEGADYSEFYEALEPHGQWIEHARYGLVWSPHAQEDEDWKPYARGSWVYTEEHGWYWQSEEEFGWAVYHYGRWRLDDEYGWIWIPGTEWGPAWVAWRQGDETVGWAPLPPEADWDPDSGLTSYSTTIYDSPRYASAWCFVPVALITAPYVWRHFAPRHRVSYYLGRTRRLDGFRAVDRRVFNRGIDRGFVERFAQRPVPVLRVRQVPTARDGLRPGGGFVGAYRPRFERNGEAPRYRPVIRPDDRRNAPSDRWTRRPDIDGRRPDFDDRRRPDFDRRPFDRRDDDRRERDARPGPGPQVLPPRREFDERRREARPDPQVLPRPDQPRPQVLPREPRREFEPPRREFEGRPREFDDRRREARPEPQVLPRPEPPRPQVLPREPRREFEPPRRESRPEPPREMRREPPPQREVRPQPPPPPARREPPPQREVQRQPPPQQPQRQQQPPPQRKSPQDDDQQRGRRGG